MKGKKGPLVVVLLILIVIVVIFSMSYAYLSSEVITVKITGTEVKRYDESDKYLINTDKGTFENTDTIWYWKWDSSDLQGKIKGKKDQTVKLKVYGWRIPFLSMYENVVEIK